MNLIRVTKEFHFEMAHALYGYDGPCKNIHGHSYSLSITVTGKVNNSKQSPKNGMVVDFSDLKNMVQQNIINEFDHALLLNGKSPHKKFKNKENIFEKIVLVNFQPTCENLLITIAKKISTFLPATVKLHHVCLRETRTSYAEWFAEDN